MNPYKLVGGLAAFVAALAILPECANLLGGFAIGSHIARWALGKGFL